MVSVEGFWTSDWVFDHWILDGNSTVYLNPCDIVMNGNHSLLAVFVEVSSTPDNAVLNLFTKAVVGKDCLTNITFTIHNQGAYTATWRSRVNVTLHLSQTALTFSGDEQILSLELGRGESRILTLTLLVNASIFPAGNYTLHVDLSPVAFERDLDDNIANCSVIVTIAGDVAGFQFDGGFPDGVVNMRDLGFMAQSVGTDISSPNWNPIIDIDNNGAVTMVDIGLACANFCKTAESG
jgi:hypothetical protein